MDDGKVYVRIQFYWELTTGWTRVSYCLVMPNHMCYCCLRGGTVACVNSGKLFLMVYTYCFCACLSSTAYVLLAWYSYFSICPFLYSSTMYWSLHIVGLYNFGSEQFRWRASYKKFDCHQFFFTTRNKLSCSISNAMISYSSRGGIHISFLLSLSRLTVVGREAKKGQSDCQKQNARWTSVSFTWANVFVIWRHNHSRYLSSRVNF